MATNPDTATTVQVDGVESKNRSEETDLAEMKADVWLDHIGFSELKGKFKMLEDGKDILQMGKERYQNLLVKIGIDEYSKDFIDLSKAFDEMDDAVQKQKMNGMYFVCI